MRIMGRPLRVALLAGIVWCLIAAATAQAGVNLWTSGGPEGAAGAGFVLIDPLHPDTLYHGAFKSTDGGARWFQVAAVNVGLAPADRQPIEQVSGWRSSGPHGGSVSALAADPRDPATLYAATNDGLFKSSDSGGSWTKLSIPGALVYFVTVAPSDSSVLYAATISPTSFGDPMNELFRSTDAGVTWTKIDEAGWPFGYFLVVDPTDAFTIYVNSGLRSTDGGSTWTSLPLFVPVGVIAIDPLVPTTLYANSYPPDAAQGVYKSTDSGATWTPTGPSAALLSFLTVDPVDHETIYAGYLAFYQSHDGGATWTSNATFPPSNLLSFAVGSGASPRLYAGTDSDGVYASADRGTTWSKAGGLRGVVRSLAVSVVQGADQLFAGTLDRGILLSTDLGASWVPRNPQIDKVAVRAVAVAASGPRRVYALAGGFARTDDGGATWSVDPLAPTALDGALAVDPSNADVVYASSATAGVLRSADGGVTWAPTFPTAHPVYSIAVDPKTPTTLYMADGWPLKSIDSGATWFVINSGIAYGVRLIAVDPFDTSTVYASNGDLYRSDDAGAGWSLVLSRGSLGYSYALSIAPDPVHPGTVYVGTYSGLAKSTDRGETWSLSSPDPFYSALSSVVLDTTGVLYATAFSTNPYFRGASPYRSLDGGATWTPIGGWLPNMSGFPQSAGPLAVDPFGRRLWAGTGADSVWQIDFHGARVAPPRPAISSSSQEGLR